MEEKTAIKNLEALFPMKDEQTAIANILSDIGKELTMFQEQLSKYKLVKQGMMQNLLTGKVRLV